MTRLKLCLHLTSQARRAREMQLCHPALLDPAASPDVPTPPSGLVQAPAHIAGCDGAQHAGSAAPMVPRACSWPHWWPRLSVDLAQARHGAVGGPRSPLHRSAALPSVGLSCREPTLEYQAQEPCIVVLLFSGASRRANAARAKGVVHASNTLYRHPRRYPCPDSHRLQRAYAQADAALL